MRSGRKSRAGVDRHCSSKAGPLSRTLPPRLVCRHGTGHAARSAGHDRGRPAASPRRAAADAVPGSVRAGSPARRPGRRHPPARAGWPEGRPGHRIGRPARVGAASPGHEPEVGVAVLAGQGGQQAGHQGDPTGVFGLDLEDVLLVADPEPALLAVSTTSGHPRSSDRGHGVVPCPDTCRATAPSASPRSIHDHTSQLKGPPDGEVAAAANDPGSAGPTPLLPKPRWSPLARLTSCHVQGRQS